jgi:hypothetical protein
MLGSGHPRLTRDLAAWNRARSSGFLLIADDAVGGFFAINGGALGEDLGAVHYLAPDTWAWESLEMGHTAFVQWAFTVGCATSTVICVGKAGKPRWPAWAMMLA